MSTPLCPRIIAVSFFEPDARGQDKTFCPPYTLISLCKPLTKRHKAKKTNKNHYHYKIEASTI
ncbi:hypothetical protein VN23_20960 [Janthinobacterium sp. B9-8]|nr:hypothetical protein VN23_20960 [Janthinobacterium sp. B9-8]